MITVDDRRTAGTERTMRTVAGPTAPVGPTAPAGPTSTHVGLRDWVLMFTGATSTQFGAAWGSHAFAAIGPAGVVAVRQLVGALVLLPMTRPKVRALTWPQWRPILVLAATFAGMNLGLYSAVERIGLGLAVTLEFLGPLAVAVGGSRRPREIGAALAAAVGVYILVLPGPSSDVIGIAFGLLGASCWAGYIVANRSVGRVLPGVQGAALATTVSAAAYLPVLGWLAREGRITLPSIGFAVLAGIFSTVVPYTIDLLVLRRVPAHVFGVAMSSHPVVAALVGLVALGQVLKIHEWVGMAIIVIANAVVVSGRRRSGITAPTPAARMSTGNGSEGQASTSLASKRARTAGVARRRSRA